MTRHFHPDPAWVAVEDWLSQTLFSPEEEETGSIFDRNKAGGLPPIDVVPTAGKFLFLLAKIAGARRVLEVGTLGGYSSTWLARALPSGGTVVTLEIDPHHAEVARENHVLAGVGDLVEVVVGPAIDSLLAFKAEGVEPFDLVFIDADKRNNANYVRLAVDLARPGTVIVVDNAVRGGAIIDPNALDLEHGDNDARGTREVLELLGSHPRLDATALQLVSSKGWDGIAVAVVR
ncbi:MAG: O-methyltransferase [Segniliparus sp.]|uniref:O-methyltransferase n=1 Tax=Segniliparus sp. TaxID=2804064 RepID=UPI003F30C778